MVVDGAVRGLGRILVRARGALLLAVPVLPDAEGGEVEVADADGGVELVVVVVGLSPQFGAARGGEGELVRDKLGSTRCLCRDVDAGEEEEEEKGELDGRAVRRKRKVRATCTGAAAGYIRKRVRTYLSTTPFDSGSGRTSLGGEEGI